MNAGRVLFPLMLVISSWSRNRGARNYATLRPLFCSDTLDHTSHMRFLERRFGVALPNDTAWRKATVGDLTGAFSFATKDASVPALPDTSLPPALTYPECDGSPMTE